VDPFGGRRVVATDLRRHERDLVPLQGIVVGRTPIVRLTKGGEDIA
jgi:hypothetical protein